MKFKGPIYMAVGNQPPTPFWTNFPDVRGSSAEEFIDIILAIEAGEMTYCAEDYDGMNACPDRIVFDIIRKEIGLSARQVDYQECAVTKAVS